MARTGAAVRPWVIGAYLLGCALVTYQQAKAWESDRTLWAHAVELAPLKPRPALNYGSALLLVGDYQRAAIWWAHAAELATQPHVPAVDARHTRRTALNNLTRLRAAL